MKLPSATALLATLALAASFLFPGVRVAGVPISVASLVSLAFLPGAVTAYSRRRLRLILCCLLGLLLIMARNAAFYGFEVRNALYLLLPLSAIGATVAIKRLADSFGLQRVQHWALGLCVINLLVMTAQATDLGGINARLEALWSANIAFVVNDDNQAEILWNTLAIRPPGLFPTGIFASTAIYVVCRSVWLTERRAWPLLVAMLAILMTANRTLAVIFVVYESVALVHAFGVWRFTLRALALLIAGALALGFMASTGGDLYLLTFLTEELGGGGVEDTASVVERLKTVEIFLANAPEFLPLGGFSTTALADADHVFDSELLLRSLQFGVVGLLCLVLIVLLPRAGRPSRAWRFLFFLALLTSVTTTFTTSIVYLMVIALYKESVIHSKVTPSTARRVPRAKKLRPAAAS